MRGGHPERSGISKAMQEAVLEVRGSPATNRMLPGRLIDSCRIIGDRQPDRNPSNAYDSTSLRANATIPRAFRGTRLLELAVPLAKRRVPTSDLVRPMNIFSVPM